MYKILLVDDEPLERAAMRLILTKNMPEIKICGEAENGFEALDIAEKTNPDIILIDINMPGMDGLETIQKMQERQYSSKFIILTSYSSFDYARQALRLGVEDFLLKPANAATVEDTIQKVFRTMSQETFILDTQKRMKEKISEMQPVVQSDIFRAICDKEKDVSEMFRILDLSPREAFIAIIEPQSDEKILYDRICRILDSKTINYISRLHSPIIDFLFFNQSDPPGIDLKECIKSLTDISPSLSIGCSKKAKKIEDISRAYQEAVTALQECKKYKPGLIFYEDMETRKKERLPIDRYVDLFCKQILLKDSDELKSLSELFFSDLSSKEVISILGKQTYVYQILFQISKRISQKTGYYRLWEEIFTEKNQFMENRDTASLKLHFLLIIDHMIEILKDNKMSRQDQIVKKTMTYIENLYDKTITLEDLSESLLLSPSHVSKVIKKTTGMNFSEILNNFRINKAMELLRKESLSIKEVTYRVGYNSQHYFSRIFKKETGFSPSDFRNSNF